MTHDEWLAGNDPDPLLAFIRDAAPEGQLRAFACACCERMWEEYAPDWAQGVFRAETGDPGGYISPADWEDPRPRAAVRVAQAFSEGQASREDLGKAHREVAPFAEDVMRNWAHANYRLGDSATGAEYEVGAVAAHAALAAAAASAADIRAAVARCADCAAQAVGFRWDDDRGREAVAAEKRVQAGMIRERFPFPGQAGEASAQEVKP
jgi:hypothetical protein